MDDIKRRPIQDVVPPRAEAIPRESFRQGVQERAREGEGDAQERMDVPPRQAPVSGGVSERIAQSSFFRKEYHREVERPSEKRSPRRFLWGALALGVLGGAGIVIANYFAGAIVEVVPITKSATLDHGFTAVKDPNSDALFFDTMSLEEEKSKEVPATIEKKIQSKASGTVTIYNAYSSAPQKLIINTRLESSDHKVFRLEKSVVVPGAKTVGGKVEPGSVEAVVYADAPGSEYNIGLSDFTIPGLKGDPRYAKFTARSVSGTPIAGGFSGTINVPTEEGIAKAQAELKEELGKSVMEKARAQVPENVSFFPGSVILKFEEVPREFSSTEEASTVTMKATISVFFFDTERLTQEILETIIPDHRGGPLALSNIADMTFTFIDPVEKVVLADLARISFKIEGAPLFMGKIDTAHLARELAGKDKKDFTKVIALEDNVKKAEATIRPFWRTVFPLDTAKISVRVVME